MSGWLTSDLAGSNVFYKMDYDDLLESPSNAVLQLSDSLRMGFSEKEVLAAIDVASLGFTRKNKGVPGRGLEFFTSKQKHKIVKCMGYFGLASEVSELV